jgi:hypothetical protein
MRRAIGLTVLAMASLVLVACGGDGQQFAADACAPVSSSSPGFDPESASLAELERNANVARQRAALAMQAADEDARWQALADAANALAAFASVLRDARMDDVPIADVTTPDMWAQAKYASDAFLAECRRVKQ